MSAFGQSLKAFRKANNYTLRDVAAAMGTSVTYVSEIERGTKVPPSVAKIVKLFTGIGHPEKTTSMLELASNERAFSVDTRGMPKSNRCAVLALLQACERATLASSTATRIIELCRS